MVFGLKKALIGKSRPTTNIEDLERRLNYCQDVLEVISKLDPGLTMQRALILKLTAQTRSEIVKALKAKDGQLDLSYMAQQALKEFPANFT